SAPIQTTFNLDPSISLQGLESDLTIEFLLPPVHYVKFDLSVFVTPIADRLHIDVHYNRDLFEAKTIRRLVQHLRTLMESISEHPNLSVWQQSLLISGEVRQLLVEWNPPPSPPNEELCIHQLFEQQVERAPDAIALVLGDEALTYDDFNR